MLRRTGWPASRLKMHMADRKIELAASLVTSGDCCFPERRVASELEIIHHRVDCPSHAPFVGLGVFDGVVRLGGGGGEHGLLAVFKTEQAADLGDQVGELAHLGDFDASVVVLGDVGAASSDIAADGSEVVVAAGTVGHDVSRTPVPEV